MKLFLDDIRYPHWVGLVDEEWIIARSFEEAVELILKNGFPSEISFDHDLGEEDAKTGYDLAKWIVDYDIDHGGTKMSVDFKFNVHSANPVGAENIRCLLMNYYRAFKMTN